jgi:hypothetical protein
MIELFLESVHVPSLLSEAVAEKPAIPLPKRMMVAFTAVKFFESLVIFYFRNTLYIIDLK